MKYCCILISHVPTVRFVIVRASIVKALESPAYCRLHVTFLYGKRGLLSADFVLLSCTVREACLLQASCYFLVRLERPAYCMIRVTFLYDKRAVLTAGFMLLFCTVREACLLQASCYFLVRLERPAYCMIRVTFLYG
jgi:hypothetical protein